MLLTACGSSLSRFLTKAISELEPNRPRSDSNPRHTTFDMLGFLGIHFSSFFCQILIYMAVWQIVVGLQPLSKHEGIEWQHQTADLMKQRMSKPHVQFNV